MCKKDKSSTLESLQWCLSLHDPFIIHDVLGFWSFGGFSLVIYCCDIYPTQRSNNYYFENFPNNLGYNCLGIIIPIVLRFFLGRSIETLITNWDEMRKPEKKSKLTLLSLFCNFLCVSVYSTCMASDQSVRSPWTDIITFGFLGTKYEYWGPNWGSLHGQLPLLTIKSFLSEVSRNPSGWVMCLFCLFSWCLMSYGPKICRNAPHSI